MQEQKTYSFYGFHGTAESCAIKIDETKYFEPGEPRDGHWPIILPTMNIVSMNDENQFIESPV
ncbi:MAG: hypothetical protein ABF649_13685 [Bacillus sp. (in: firmicutes)]